MRNVIAIRRGLVLVPTAGTGDAQLAATLQSELMNLGFALDAAAFAAVSAADPDWIIRYSQEVIPALQNQLGADRSYRPFYKNFPTDVMSMSDIDLFLNAVRHYWSIGTWEPTQVLVDRGFQFESVDFKPVRSGTDDDLKRLFTTLAAANQSLTAQDKALIEWLIAEYPGQLELPAAIPFKETLCMLAAHGLDVPIKTTTDVLRVAVYLSGGDVSLPGVPKPAGTENWKAAHSQSPWTGFPWFRRNMETQINTQKLARDKFKFKKFSRPQRRLLLGLLEKTNVDVADMQRHLGRWLRLGETLHPGEQATRFPRAAAAFLAIRNQRKGSRVRTFAASVDLAFKSDWRAGVDLLATRPGEFARRLDWMLRSFKVPAVLTAFDKVSPLVSSKVLIELHNHFTQRHRADAPRAVMIKGVRSKLKTLPPLPPMDADLVQRVGNSILSIMRQRIAKLPPLGRVWIDPELKHVPVPFAMRSMNTSVKTYVRGTRVRFDVDAKVIRPFIHWFDKDGTEDLDLSVGLYDEKLKSVGHVSFTGLKDLGCCHSGDIRCRQGPCAEYVDIPVESAVAHGVRYAIVQVHNYNARPMHSVPDCVFGLMERQTAVANEIFVPKTISTCMKLANEGTTVIVCIIDLKEGQYIWADVETRGYLPTLETTAGKATEVLRSLLRGTKMSVHQMLSLHAESRGTEAPDPTQADVVYRADDFVTDYAAAAVFMNF